MPNRTLKETICTSETIEALTPSEEVTFYRLLVSVDDYGRADARPQILLTKLYPLKIGKMSAKDVAKHIAKLEEVGLLYLYEVDGKSYLQVSKWDRHQRIRAKYSKFPSPEEGRLTPCVSGDGAKNGSSEKTKHTKRLRALFEERFWTEYPRKKAKQNAWEAFQRVFPYGQDPVNLDKRWNNMRKHLEALKDERRPIDKWPYPATFLNGEDFDSPPEKPPADIVAPEREFEEIEDFEEVGV
jgi:DNA-binding transcriptional ArsR family regulator